MLDRLPSSACTPPGRLRACPGCIPSRSSHLLQKMLCTVCAMHESESERSKREQRERTVKVL